MDEKDIKKIVKLRQHIISEYRGLTFGPEAPTAVIKQSDVGYTLETIIRSIDDILKPYVNFES